MFDQVLFKPNLLTGQTIKITPPNGNPFLDSCDANIGVLQGQGRSIPAILCDGADETDQWQILNIVNEKNVLLDHVAVKGAVSDEQGIRLCQKYLKQAQSGIVHSQVAVNPNALKTFLDGASLPCNTAFFLEPDALLLDSVGTVASVQWQDESLISHNGQLTSIMLDMANCDIEGHLTEQVTPRDIVSMLLAENVEFIKDGMLDAMIIKNRQLDMTIQKLAEALKSHDHEDFFVKAVTPIAPFKRNGVVNVGVTFTMSDTQIITILFNNPDTTPSKLSPDDVLTSWKWMLNKRDVTAVLQPRSVDAKKYAMIASRMVQLLAKNHDRFKRAQILKSKDESLLNELVAQVEASQLELRSLDQQGLDIQSQIDAETLKKQQDTEVGKINEQDVQLNKKEIIAQKALNLNDLLINTYGFIKNAEKQQTDGKFELISSNGNELTISVFIDETYNDKWTLGLWMGDTANKLKDINYDLDIEDLALEIIKFDSPGTTLEQIEKNIEVVDGVPKVKGDEFGLFTLPEDSKNLRKVVQAALKEMNGKSYSCPALNAEVEIRNSGIKKVISLSGDSRKLQAIAALKALLSVAELVESQKTYATATEQNIVAYHILRAPLQLKDELVNVRFVVREDDKGHYHYDHQINSGEIKNTKSPLLDGLIVATLPKSGVSQVELAKLTRNASCQLDNSIENDHNHVNIMLDDAGGSGLLVLNMFIEKSEVFQNEQSVQMNNNNAFEPKITRYSIKSPKPKARKPIGSIRITTRIDGLLDVHFEKYGVGGDYVGDLAAIKAWLIHRMSSLGDAMSEDAVTFEDILPKLIFKEGDDLLGVSTTQTTDDNQNNDVQPNEVETFLNQVIAGEVNMSDPSFGDRLLEIGENLDPSLEALFEQASDVYADYAISLEV